MTRLLALLLVLGQAAPRDPALYPDPQLTPGVVLTTSRKTVCVPGYTAKIRSVPAKERRAAFARYGLTDSSRWPLYELDHEVSLELGGSNAIENLWPELYAGEYGARSKDVVETSLHSRVCRGELTLKQAQAIILVDWLAEYKRLKGIQ
jgi:hypothetical protein